MIKILTLGIFLLTTMLFNIPKSSMSNLKAVIDGYQYDVNGDIVISLSENLLFFPSNINNCVNEFDTPPSPKGIWTLETNSEVIGMTDIRYNITFNTLILTSSDTNVVCDSGKFVDVIFANDFEESIFKNGFEQEI